MCQPGQWLPGHQNHYYHHHHKTNTLPIYQVRWQKFDTFDFSEFETRISDPHHQSSSASKLTVNPGFLHGAGLSLSVGCEHQIPQWSLFLTKITKQSKLEVKTGWWRKPAIQLVSMWWKVAQFLGVLDKLRCVQDTWKVISIIAVQPTLEQNCDTSAQQMDGLNRPPGELGLAGDIFSYSRM